MKRYITLVFFIVFSVIGLYAQSVLEENSEIVGDLRSTFSKLNKSHIIYGALRDRAVELVDFDEYDGLHSDVYSTNDSYMYLLKSVRTLYETFPTWQAESVLYEQEEQNSLSNCPISVLLYHFVEIKDNALADSLISYDGDYVTDVYKDGVWQNPYQVACVFSFAPADTLYYNNVDFSFPKDLFKTNTGGIFEFDPDDGLGFRSMNLSTSSHTISVSYSNAGEHNLRLRFNRDGKEYSAKFRITTIPETTVTRASNAHITYEDISSTYEDNVIEGRLWRYNRSTNHLKPFLIVEGFDISMDTNTRYVYNHSGYGMSSMENLDDELSSLYADYDVYYLDWKDPTLKIEANATLLEKALSYIEADKAKYSSADDNIILGSSMGGLVVRYCLRSMELNSKLHHTHTIICQDTPNLGANVPLGVLFGIHGLKKLYTQWNGKIYGPTRTSMRMIDNIVNSEAAKEMLFYYVNDNGYIDNSAHYSFLAKLKSMGYPVGDNGTLRSLAISNGNESCIDVNDPIFKLTASFNPSMVGDAILNLLSFDLSIFSALFSKNLWTGFLMAMPGHSNIKCDIDLEPVGATNTDNLALLNFQYKKKVAWLINFKSTLFKYQKKQISGVLNFDIARTSYYSSKLLENVNQDIYYKGNRWGINFGEINGKLECARQIPFIPTVSALDIGEGKTAISQSDLSTVYSMQGPRPGGTKYIPFDGYYINKSTDKHITVNEDIINWLQEQLKLGVEGDEIGDTGSKYAIVNNTQNLPVEWSSSDESIASIDEDGVLTAHQHGYITVKGTLSNGLAFPKYVMVGFPKYNISVLNESNYVRFTYSQYSDKNCDFRMFSPYIKYQVSGSDVNFKDVDVNYYDVARTTYGGGGSAYFRSVYTSKTKDRFSEIVSATASTAYPYTLTPSYFYLSEFNGITSIELTQSPYYYGTLPDEFKIYYFESHGGTPKQIKNVTSMTIDLENVFSSYQIQEFKKNASKHSISNDFIIRGQKGNVIQQFKVTYIR